MSQPKLYTRCEDSVAGPGSRPSCPGTQSEHSGATSIVRYHRIPHPVMSSFRYSHEITSVQRLMLHYLRIPRACFRTANMLQWVQSMVSRPRFQWHTETKEPSPILHMSLGHASLSVNGNPSNSITGSIRLTAVVLRTPLYMMPPFRKTPNSPSERSVKKHINQRSRTNPFILWDPLLLPRSIDTAACPRVLSCNTKCCPNIKYGRDDGHDEDGPQRSNECWYHEKSVVSATAEG